MLKKKKLNLQLFYFIFKVHHNLAETNGSSKHLHYTHGGTLTREHTQLPPTSGNWHHPAGPYTGYHRMQRNYLKMATKVRPILCLANFVNQVKILIQIQSIIWVYPNPISPSIMLLPKMRPMPSVQPRKMNGLFENNSYEIELN